MPQDPERLDSKDRKIVEAIIQNPRGSYPLLAKLTGIPESTLQKRVGDLVKRGRLARFFQVLDWPAAGYPRKYNIDIQVDQRNLAIGKGGPYGEESSSESVKINSQEKLATYIKYTLGQKYVGRIVILDVSILLGHTADLRVTVVAKGRVSIMDFVTNGLRTLGGIQSTSTSEEIWSCPPLPALGAIVDQVEQPPKI